MSSVDAVHVDGTAVVRHIEDTRVDRNHFVGAAVVCYIGVEIADLHTRFDWCTRAGWYTRVAQDKLVRMNELVLVALGACSLVALDV